VGAGGSTIRELEDVSRARVKLGEKSAAVDGLVPCKLRGPTYARAAARKLLETWIAAGRVWFPQAVRSGAGSMGGGGGGKGGKGGYSGMAPPQMPYQQLTNMQAGLESMKARAAENILLARTEEEYVRVLQALLAERSMGGGRGRPY